MNEERLKNMEKHFFEKVEEFAKKYPKDIGRLYESYKTLKTQKKSEDYLNGYLGTISDLIIIKQGHWGDGK